MQNNGARIDTAKPAPKRPKRGQIVERAGQRYIVASVACNGVAKLHTESGAFAMISHVNKSPAPKPA